MGGISLAKLKIPPIDNPKLSVPGKKETPQA
jgi:hypothetical protein